jgi:hypothetical protein
MTGADQLQAELKRLRSAVEEEDSSDPVDAIVIETLADSALQEVLAGILDEGAVLSGVVLDQAGTLAGLAQLTFVCDWEPGTSHVGEAPSAVAVVEVSPPRVLKVERASASSAAASAAAARFRPPRGLVPPVLSGAETPSAEEVLRFQFEANEVFEDWRRRVGLPNETLGIVGFTTGTQCSSLLCFERHSDDFD